MLVIKAHAPVEVNTGPIKARDMTLRDHFAGLAMQACINKGYQAAVDQEFIAEMAYAAADAMMKERSK